MTELTRFFALQDKAAKPVETLLKKAAKAKRGVTRIKYIEQARELVAQGNIAFNGNEFEWLVANLDWLYGAKECAKVMQATAPIAPEPTPALEVPADHPLRPVFERAAKKTEQQRLDQIEADKLIASFDKRTPEQKLAALNPKSGAQRYTSDYQDYMEDRSIQ